MHVSQCVTQTAEILFSQPFSEEDAVKHIFRIFLRRDHDHATGEQSRVCNPNRSPLEGIAFLSKQLALRTERAETRKLYLETHIKKAMTIQTSHLVSDPVELGYLELRNLELVDEIKLKTRTLMELRERVRRLRAEVSLVSPKSVEVNREPTSKMRLRPSVSESELRIRTSHLNRLRKRLKSLRKRGSSVSLDGNVIPPMTLIAQEAEFADLCNRRKNLERKLKLAHA